VVLGGGVPLVRPQEELRYPSGDTPRGFAPSPGPEAKSQLKDFWILYQKIKQQKKEKKDEKKRSNLCTPTPPICNNVFIRVCSIHPN